MSKLKFFFISFLLLLVSFVSYFCYLKFVKYRNTKIIRLDGGLGNQLYQVAFGETLRLKTGMNIKYDLREFEKEQKLKNNRSWVRYYFDKMNTKLDLLNVNKIEYAIVRSYPFRAKCNRYGFDFDEKCFDINSGTYYKAYLQNPLFFKGYEDKIREMFTKLNPKYEDELDEKNKAMIEEMQSHKNSVVINIRLGDFLRHPALNICNFDYYKKAMKVFENMEDVHYYIFSDDIEGARKYFKTDKPHTFVDVNPLEKPYLNLILSSSAKHNIVSNSSFAIWAGMLNSNPNKIVVCPSEIIKNIPIKASEKKTQYRQKRYYYSSEIYPKEWIKIDTRKDRPINIDEIDTKLTSDIKKLDIDEKKDEKQYLQKMFK